MSMLSSAKGIDANDKMNKAATTRGLLISMVVNVVPVFILYQVLRIFVHASDTIALPVSSIPAIMYALVGIVRQRRIDFLSGFLLVAIAIGTIFVLLGGDPRFYLLRQSLIAIVLGGAYLVSLLFPKPLWFYLGRYFLAGNDPENMARFNAQWQYPAFRSAMRLLTLVWGMTSLLTVAIYIALVLTLPIALLVIILPMLDTAFWVFLLGWTTWYVRRMLKRLEEMKKAESDTVPVEATEVIS